MIENLTVILGADNDIKEAVIFPCEDEIMGILAGGITNDCNSDQEANPTSPGEVFYTPYHPLVVFWDMKRKIMWFIGFYVDHNYDGTFRVDHLKRANTG